MSLVPRNNKEKNLEGAKRSETQKEREENVQCLKCGTCKIKNMFYKKNNPRTDIDFKIFFHDFSGSLSVIQP